MRRLVHSARDLLGEYPLTALGVVIGVAFAVVLWTRQDATNHEVQKITERVVVIERQQGAQRQHVARLTCSSAHPHSAACRALSRAIVRVQHDHARHHAQARRSPAGRPQAPSRHTGSSAPAPQPSAPSPSGSPRPPAPVQVAPAEHGSSGASVEVKPNASVGVRTPDVTATTPAGDLRVPGQDVTVGPLP